MTTRGAYVGSFVPSHTSIPAPGSKLSNPGRRSCSQQSFVALTAGTSTFVSKLPTSIHNAGTNIRATRSSPGSSALTGVSFHFAVMATAEGTEVGRWPAPRPLARRLQRMRRHSRSLSRKRRGSSNRAKAARRLSRDHARVTYLRGSFLHEVSSQLAKTHSRLAIEDLQVANLLASRRLARAISDVGWGEFARQLTYKAEWFDCELTVCDRWFPSTKTCRACGMLKKHMELAERIFRCDSCGSVCDRDRNAAANLAAWAERAQSSRTAKQAAGSTMPLEGTALAIVVPMVKPVPTKGNRRSGRRLSSGTSEKDGVGAPPRCATRFNRSRSRRSGSAWTAGGGRRSGGRCRTWSAWTTTG